MLRNRVIVLFAICSTSAFAQWLNYSVPGTPRTRDGKPNLSAPAPRALNGKPDLSGVWHVQPTGMAEMKRLFGDRADATDVPGMELDTISKYGINILQDFKAEEWPIRPAAAQIMRGRTGADFPSTHCLPLGVPLASLLSEPIKIVQSPKLIAILYEADDKHRQIYTDGRVLPKQFDQPAWLGYSVGRWERDTLVVDSVGFNEDFWLDRRGLPHTEQLHTIERFTRTNKNTIDYKLTIDDPGAYEKPFDGGFTLRYNENQELFEYVCQQNDQAPELMVGEKSSVNRSSAIAP